MSRTNVSALRNYTGTGSASCDGTGNGYILVANNSLLSLTTDFTIFLWVNIAAYGASGYEVLERGDIGVTTTGSYKIFIGSTGTLRFTDVNVADINDTGTKKVPLSAWVPIAITHTGNSYNFFINGLKNSTVTNANNCTANTRALVIGRRSGTTPNALNGKTSGVGIWQTALNDEQIHYLSNGGAIPTSSLSMYLPFVETSGSNVQDISGNGNKGTVSGSGTSLSSSGPTSARSTASSRSAASGRVLVV